MNKKKAVMALLTILMMLMIISGCNPDEMDRDKEQDSQASLSFTAEEFPRVDGSTATIPLSEAFAAHLMGITLEEAQQIILHNKTHEAYVNLIDGNTDLIFVTSPSEEELAIAAEKGIELEVIPIVSEGFVFLANRDNPVEGLTVQEIVDIYAGNITNWKEVGGNDEAIIAFQRPVNSGSQTGMLDLVMKDVAMVTPPQEKIALGMGDLIDAVAGYDNSHNALGYSYFYYVTDMWGLKETKLLKVDGVYPDRNTINDGSYPITTAYYAVIRANEEENSNVRKMVEWILSEEGQQIAQEAGYVKISK